MNQSSRPASLRTWKQTLSIFAAFAAAPCLHYVCKVVEMNDGVYGVLVALEGSLIWLGIIIGRGKPLTIVKRIISINKQELEPMFIERIAEHSSLALLWKVEAASTLVLAMSITAVFEYSCLGPYPLLFGVLVYYPWIFWWARRKVVAIEKLIDLEL